MEQELVALYAEFENWYREETDSEVPPSFQQFIAYLRDVKPLISPLSHTNND